jgi:hypothetical protein
MEEIKQLLSNNTNTLECVQNKQNTLKDKLKDLHELLNKFDKKLKIFYNDTNNIYNKLKTPYIAKTYMSEIIGYHIINDEPIKESSWEEINRNIVKKYINTSEHANGSHKSGKDCKFNEWGISNKSCKKKKNKIDISSYRLTTVCNVKDCGDINKIIDEINKRDDTFHYYSILVREEKNDNINYEWYIIPKDYYIFNPSINDWYPTFDKKNIQNKWKSDYMDITFSMSSQLWFHFDIRYIKQFLITSVLVNKKILHKMSYTDIYKIYYNTSI